MFSDNVVNECVAGNLSAVFNSLFSIHALYNEVTCTQRMQSTQKPTRDSLLPLCAC